MKYNLHQVDISRGMTKMYKTRTMRISFMSRFHICFRFSFIWGKGSRVVQRHWCAYTTGNPCSNESRCSPKLYQSKLWWEHNYVWGGRISCLCSSDDIKEAASSSRSQAANNFVLPDENVCQECKNETEDDLSSNSVRVKCGTEDCTYWCHAKCAHIYYADKNTKEMKEKRSPLAASIGLTFFLLYFVIIFSSKIWIGNLAPI